MSIVLRLAAPLLAAGAAAAIVAAPAAMASDNHLECTYVSEGNIAVRDPGQRATQLHPAAGHLSRRNIRSSTAGSAASIIVRPRHPADTAG